MRIDTSAIKGSQLNYAVAVLLGAQLRPNSIGAQHIFVGGKYIGGFVTRKDAGIAMPWDVFAPSRNPSAAHDTLQARLTSVQRNESGWHAVANGAAGKAVAQGDTMLVACWRAAVIAELGEKIDIPDWLEE